MVIRKWNKNDMKENQRWNKFLNLKRNDGKIKYIVICEKEIMRKKIEDFDAKIKKIKENFHPKNLKIYNYII